MKHSIERSIQRAGVISCSLISLRSVGEALTALAVLWATAVNVDARNESKDWIVLNNCRLIVNPANDGDSFHVEHQGREHIFRLYFVDTPETNEI